jgi:hypothetical protein
MQLINIVVEIKIISLALAQEHLVGVKYQDLQGKDNHLTAL